MKKVLVTLLVFAVAVSGVFAAVNFSGSLTSGYVIQNRGGNWESWIFGDDNRDTNSTTLKVNIADENGYWSSSLEGALYVDGSHTGDGHQNRVAGDITVDLAKIIAGPETEWSAQIQLLAFDRITALRAYTNKSGLNYDRVRTAEEGVWANAIVGYGKLIQFQIGGAPALQSGYKDVPVTGGTGTVPGTPGAGGLKGETKGDLIISAMTEPLDGLRVSVDWAWKGDQSYEGVFGAAADINVGALCGLDFDLGVGVADKWYYGEGGNNIVSAQVYGGIDMVSGFAEYVYESKEKVSRLHLGLDLNVVDSMILNFYGGVGDFREDQIKQNWYVGGNVGYEVAGVTFQLNLQYAAYSDTYDGYLNKITAGGDKGGDIAQGAVKASGFSITPMIKVAF